MDRNPHLERKPLLNNFQLVIGIALIGLCLVGIFRYAAPHLSTAPATPSPATTSPVNEETRRLALQIAWQATAERLLRESLRDPESLVIEGYGTPKEAFINQEKVAFGQVHYRARNGFGGMNRTAVWAVIAFGPGNSYLVELGDWDDWKKKNGFHLPKPPNPTPSPKQT